jgi:hypothetical protein
MATDFSNLKKGIGCILSEKRRILNSFKVAIADLGNLDFSVLSWGLDQN